VRVRPSARFPSMAISFLRLDDLPSFAVGAASPPQPLFEPLLRIITHTSWRGRPIIRIPYPPPWPSIIFQLLIIPNSLLDLDSIRVAELTVCGFNTRSVVKVSAAEFEILTTKRWCNMVSTWWHWSKSCKLGFFDEQRSGSKSKKPLIYLVRSRCELLVLLTALTVYVHHTL